MEIWWAVVLLVEVLMKGMETNRVSSGRDMIAEFCYLGLRLKSIARSSSASFKSVIIVFAVLVIKGIMIVEIAKTFWLVGFSAAI
jgi:hypothetical protein